jgi:hypothetical protein
MPADEGKLGSGSSMSGSDVSSLVKLFTGSKTTGSESGSQSTQNSGAVTNTGTTTTGTSMSSDAMAAMLKSVLESNQGLASTALGEHSAGLYNSSTNQLLQNDLITRAAAQVAQNTKTQTVTQNTAQTDSRGSTTATAGTKNSTTSPPINPATAGKGALTIAGINAASKFMPAGTGTSIVNKIKSGLGIGDGANSADIQGASIGAANSRTEAADLQSVYPSSAPSNTVNTGMDVTGPVSDAGDMDFGAGAGESGSADALSSIGSIDVSGGSDFGSVDYSGEGYDPGAFDVGAGVAADNFADFGSDVVDAGSSGLSDIFDMFAADGGLIRDPNRPDGPAVTSNLSFAQQNPVAMRMAQSVRPMSSAAGYARGGMVRRGYADGGQVSDAQPKSESIFDRRRAAIDAAESDTVQGKDTNAAYQSRMNQQSQEPKKDSGSSSGFIPSIRKVLHLANGGAVGFFDDGGHVDLTNLGLRVQPTGAASGPGLAALNAPTSSASDTSGSEVTGPQDHGTGFANTSNQTLTTNTPQTAKKSSNPSNGNTRTEPAGESNTTAPGTAQGGIDSSPQSVQNAAVSLGLAMTPLAPLAPIINAILSLSPATAGTATAAAGDAATAAAATGSVSVGSIGVADDGIDGNIGTMSSAVSAEGPNAEGSVSGESTSDASGPAGASTADGGVSDSGIGASDSGDGGDSGVGGDSASAGDSAGGDSGSYATGGNITGPGTEDSDSIPTKLSNGEFVVNAAAAAQFRPLLEMMNNAVRAK